MRQTDGKAGRERDAVMVEAAASVDYIMRERLIDSEGWLVWMTMAVIRIVFERCGGTSVWCECVWVCVIQNVIFSQLWDY